MAIKILPAFTLEAGQEPETDTATKGAICLRDWQKDGLLALEDATYRILLAPTGSGKSTLIKVLSDLDLAADPKRKAVIAVPQAIIASSFGPAAIKVGARTINWTPNTVLIDTDDSISKLVAFLAAPASDNQSSRIFVCTHQALVLAHARLAEGHPRRVVRHQVPPHLPRCNSREHNGP